MSITWHERDCARRGGSVRARWQPGDEPDGRGRHPRNGQRTAIRQRSGDLDARGDALYGAWLCGTVLGGVGTALHH